MQLLRVERQAWLAKLRREGPSHRTIGLRRTPEPFRRPPAGPVPSICAWSYQSRALSERSASTQCCATAPVPPHPAANVCCTLRSCGRFSDFSAASDRRLRIRYRAQPAHWREAIRSAPSPGSNRPRTRHRILPASCRWHSRAKVPKRVLPEAHACVRSNARCAPPCLRLAHRLRRPFPATGQLCSGRYPT